MTLPRFYGLVLEAFRPRTRWADQPPANPLPPDAPPAGQRPDLFHLRQHAALNRLGRRSAGAEAGTGRGALRHTRFHRRQSKMGLSPPPRKGTLATRQERCCLCTSPPPWKTSHMKALRFYLLTEQFIGSRQVEFPITLRLPEVFFTVLGEVVQDRALSKVLHDGRHLVN